MVLKNQTLISDNPKVSVIMNCLNCAQYLREAIDSVYAQTYQDWEIIFFDNGSHDSSGEIAKSYDSKLKYFKGEGSVSLGKARNYAVEKARGEYLAFLDCDDIWLSEKLEKQLALFNSNKDVSFAYSNYFNYYMKSNSKKIGVSYVPAQGDVFESFLYDYPVALLTVMIKKDVLKNLDHIFDESLSYAEEYDLFMRILYNNNAMYVDEPLSVYRIHSEMRTLTYKKKMIIEEAKYVMEKLNKFSSARKDKYLKAFKYYEMKYVDARLAVVCLMEGELEKARKHIAPYKYYKIKYYLIYLCTFLPHYVFGYLMRYAPSKYSAH